MVISLEDFLRRRSKISQVVEHEKLLKSKGLREACRILFGARAEECWLEYFGQPWDVTTDSEAPLQASSHLHDRAAEG